MTMRLIAIAAVSVTALLGTSGLLMAQDAMHSSWDNVYSAAQAARGKALFQQNCAKCHGSSLEGSDEIPPLTGAHFMADWDAQSVADLAKRIRSTMPLDNPGTLSSTSVTDIVAFILSSNQMPAGSAELPNDASMQGQLRIDAVKPSTK